MTIAKLAGVAASLGLAMAAGPTEAAPAAGPVIELRQYKIVPGKRDTMIELFEARFIESQEALGMRLVGQFRDLDDPDRFTWIREFPDMARREPALTAFYSGTVWQAHRDGANPLLDDNDNVLLLRPAGSGQGFGPLVNERPASGATARPAGMVVATIYYLWKDPDEGFTAFFRGEVAPALEAAGLPVLGAYVPEATPNNFPRLPVRQGEKVFVWFTRASDQAAYDPVLAKLKAGERLRGYQERRAQVLRLAPTPRSLLR